ncbi:MAG: hypothetical protein KAI29_21520, partial [Cyclobacteriaceae bacterium]|nr:hypothetical protein [Cyclobacteriaceae bacterium]
FLLAGVRYRRSRIVSPIEYIESRFNRATHTTISIIFGISLLYWPIQHLASIGKMVAPILFPGSEAAIIITILVLATLVLIYTLSGGLWAVVVTDAVQSFLVLGVVTIMIGVMLIEIPDALDKLPPFTIHPPADEKSYDTWYLVAYIMQMVFSAAMGDRAQRYYSVRDERAVFKLGILTTALFCIGPILFGLVPLIATVIWPDPSLIPGFEGLKNPQEGVFIAMAARYLPPGILGMFIAAMVSATMSATDTCWNTASAIVSIDIYKKFFRQKATDLYIMKIGRIAIVFFFVVAIAGALMITVKGIKLDIIGVTMLILSGLAISIPLALGLVVRKISQWAAVGAVVFGTIAAIVSSDLSIFGPIEIVGFLKYPFGYRVFFILGVTLSVFLLSLPMGRLGRNKIATLIFSITVAVGLWFFFLFFNTNEALSWNMLFGTGQPADSTHNYFIVMTIAALTFGYLTFLFCKLYARDLDKPEPEVDKFFALLKTPIDVKKEVGDESATATVYPFVGIIVIGLAVISLALLLFPEGRVNPGVNISLAVFLVLLGLLIMRGGKIMLREM